MSVITLCGSTRFKEDFLRVQRELSLQGHIVLSVGLFGHADNEPLTTETKAMLDSMHKQKIDMSSEIFVINKDGYIGESTRSEIQYAHRQRKKVTYMEPYVSSVMLKISKALEDHPVHARHILINMEDYECLCAELGLMPAKVYDLPLVLTDSTVWPPSPRAIADADFEYRRFMAKNEA